MRVRRALVAVLVAVAAAASAQVAYKRAWPTLAADGLHDPASPALAILQEPSEALSALPPDFAGNLVNWMASLDGGYIKPRSTVLADTRVTLRSTDVLLKRTGELPLVVFPHRQHTAWLDCTNCHDQLFQQKAGGTMINMFLILQGEKCGVCHGAVAFPLTECARCHSVARGSDAEKSFRNLVRG